MSNTTIFRASGFRGVRADSAQEAARVFGLRAARSEFGSRGSVHAIREAGHSSAGLHYDVMIGRPAHGGGAIERTLSMVVYAAN